MSRSDLPALTIAELQSLLRRKEVSPREMIDALRARIENVEPKIDAYLSIDFDAAANEADKVNVDLPLGGVPIAIKDIINVKGQPCTCGSKILANYRSPYDATVIQKLRAAGAVPFGKTNMDEFAMGSSTENSSVKVTRNPWDMSRVPGGSSGGSAAAVAADSAFGGLGTDTGGSIRQPASLCGVVGVKPSYGRVSRFGLVAFASSLDQVGPLTKTVRDSALIMNAMAGHDPQDSTSLNEPVPDYTKNLGRDRCGRAAAGTARNTREVPRIARHFYTRIFGGRAHREFVHVGFAEWNRARRAQFLNHGRVVRRSIVRENLRPACARLSFDIDDVFDRNRHAAERKIDIHLVGFLSRGLEID